MNNDEKNTPKQCAATNQYAYIWNYNAHVEHQHNYYGDKPEHEAKDYELIDLKFFDDGSFDSLEQQDKLRTVLTGILPRMDVDSGRDWVAVYIAYHYYIGREYIIKGHSDFFADIEALLPGVLKKINSNETGDKRYKAYTDLLRLECQNWFIVDDCLPPIREWTSARYMYKVDKARRDRMQKIVIDIYQGLKK